MSQAQPVPCATKNLFTEGLLQNPYPIYRRFLEEGPIHYVDYGSGMWAVFSHAGCSTSIREPLLSSKRTAALLRDLPAEKKTEFAELARMIGLWMLFIDAPEHTRLRKLMNKGFAPAVVEALRPRIGDVVDQMLVPLRRTGKADLLKEIAYPLPARVIAKMLGLPDTMSDYLVEWSDAIATLFGNPHRTIEHYEAAQQAVLALTKFFREAVAQRRRQRGNDLISLLLEIEEDGDVLTDEELYAQCVMLLFGGHETTRNLIGNGLYTLLQHPEQMAELQENPSLIRTAVEELLRYESPVQYFHRVAREELEICGVRLRQGQPILFMIGAANRDRHQFADPDRLDLKRTNNSHLAFGAGGHFCIGNQLARLEGQVAILKILQQFPGVRLKQPLPQWAGNFALRGLQALPVLL